ncbi:MAG: NAD(+) diphosphatase [Spirochaetales bacterium]|nr:NAD(+) diphosphatase [Spirochaetales bacterium]
MDTEKANKPKQQYLHDAYKHLYQDFTPGYRHEPTDCAGFWFCFHDDLLLITQNEEGKTTVPRGACPLGSSEYDGWPLYMGAYKGIDCFVLRLSKGNPRNSSRKFEKLRPLFDILPPEEFALAGRASQILHWNLTHQFCGICGEKTRDAKTERAKECPQCGELYYPRVTPAVIAAVTRGDLLLLARSRRWTKQIFSVVAGFVEPGETLEQAVEREVKEETAIEVKNIRYFGSQPWPFPTQLMVAFTAEYKQGDIVVDENELQEAKWVSREEIKTLHLPGSLSIARELIDWFLSSE